MAAPATSRAKRYFDILFAAIALAIAAPLIAAIAIAIRASTPGPAFFTQRRVGLRGRPFTLYKFRTLSDVAPREATLAVDDDAITPIGRLLRRTSLDELPQLLNIFGGTMSLVGPRPALPEQVERYDVLQRRRLETKPGLTGWAQVNGRNAISWQRRIDLDIHYVDNWSIGLDFCIILRTFKVVLTQ